ncbi:hypothetical protein HPP92_021639 [Vanilla planifolia]|uniref:peptidyl-tRNA hydrolase n=1 Tax=Vanilla planifolia TaxID=51239 RepID=A0A835UIZ6_VANPL|nr:hypothetical protein HPP92_021639 [Vanilla planifolia]
MTTTPPTSSNAGDGTAEPSDVLVQGASSRKGCHAAVFAIWSHVDRADTTAYLAASNIHSMYKVTLEVKGEAQIKNLAEKLKADGIEHKLWIEQPENIPTCLATRPYPKSLVSSYFKKLKALQVLHSPSSTGLSPPPLSLSLSTSYSSAGALSCRLPLEGTFLLDVFCPRISLKNLRNNLQHPNEYIRGVTLRFLCRLSEAEIMEPLIPSILSNLEHRHPFIRRNAILAVMSIYKLAQGEQLLADAPEFSETEEIKAKAQISHAQPDDLIDFYHLKSRKGMSQLELEGRVQDDLKRATGEFTKDADDANKLNRILQLTGFSDPVYAEAYVTVHHYDIVLDVTVINRTKDTLQNLCLELATMGDLKLVERPQNYTLAPESSKQIRANIKVSSTETGVIFGNIVYETSNVLERTVVVLNDIHIDIMDCLSGHVAVNTVIQDEKEFLNHIIKSTNMKCLTAPSALDGECGFLAANLYAKSVFGEDALVNISIEKQGDGKLSGYIRIRSKTQGIALSLGDKITLKQKGSG